MVIEPLNPCGAASPDRREVVDVGVPLGAVVTGVGVGVTRGVALGGAVVGWALSASWAAEHADTTNAVTSIPTGRRRTPV